MLSVTGVSGFVGKALAKELLRQGHQVRGISRTAPQDLSDPNYQHYSLDLSSSLADLKCAFEGVQGIFHVAAKVSMTGRYADFYQTNVVGTQNVIECAKQLGIGRLVYTSSPSVVADGSNLNGVDESQPIPSKHHANYPATKAIAEKMVLAANGPDLKTLALRPHLIFGPGDTNLIPTVLNKAKSGRLRIIGDGNNLSDFTFITDCVAAHIAAYHALESNPNSRGRAYFISQGDPVRLWDWVNKVLRMNNLPEISRKLSIGLAINLARASELVARVIPNFEPALTQFLVSEMSTNHYFNISAARSELGYKPSLKVFECLELMGMMAGDKKADGLQG